MTRYQIKGLLKFAEEDNYKDGCLPDTATHYSVDYTFNGTSKEEVIKKVADFLGVGEDGIERNACDDKGRIDFALMEDDEGTSPSKSQIDAWKKGRERLWYVIYTGHLEKVTLVSA